MGLERLLEETPEAYYWIGFLMADGYIRHEKNTLRLRLSLKDEDHLKQYAFFIGERVKYEKGCCLVEKSGDVVKKIAKKFDFKPRKTYNPPRIDIIKNDDLFLSFLTGMIDGDGSFSKSGQLMYGCHASWIENIDFYFKRAWKISGCELEMSSMKIPSAYLDRSGMCLLAIRHMSFLHFLRDRSYELSLPILHRKWQRIPEMKKKHCNTFDIKNEVKKLLSDGMSRKQIALHMGLWTTSVNRIIRKDKKFFA
jgi:hypothetical protein